MFSTAMIASWLYHCHALHTGFDFLNMLNAAAISSNWHAFCNHLTHAINLYSNSLAVNQRYICSSEKTPAEKLGNTVPLVYSAYKLLVY